MTSFRFLAVAIISSLALACEDSHVAEKGVQAAHLTGTFQGYQECVVFPTNASGDSSMTCGPRGSRTIQQMYDVVTAKRAAICNADESCLSSLHAFRIYPACSQFLDQAMPAIGATAAVQLWWQQVAPIQTFAATLPATDQVMILSGLMEERGYLQAKVDAVHQTLVDKESEVVDAGRAELLGKAEETRGPIVLDLAQSKSAATAVNAIVAKYRDRLAPLALRVGSLTAAYADYRNQEVLDVGSIDALTHSSVGLTTYAALADLKVRLSEVAATSSERAAPIMLEAIRLSAELVDVESQLLDELDPYQDFFDRFQVERPRVATDAAVAVSKIGEYVRASQKRVQGNIVTSLAQVHRRNELLIISSVHEATRQVIAQTEGAHASARFLDAATAMIAAAWKTPANSTVLHLPYLRPQYEAMQRLLEMEPVCTGASRPDYGVEGCQILATHYARIRANFGDALPLRLNRDANKFATVGVDATLVAALRYATQIRDLALAVDLHDQALTASEVHP